MPPPPAIERVVVQPLTEYRIELEPGEKVAVQLLNGHAELFGFELAEGVEYPLGDEVRAAVFSWTGAEIQIRTCSTAYLAEETPYPSHYNVHLALEHLRSNCRPPPAFLPEDDPIRQAALQGGQQEDETSGPRVLVVGESGAGKSTLCKSLLNWAIRAGKARKDGSWTDVGSGRKVLFVNLDPADGAFTVPGTFSAAAIDTLLPTSTPVHPFGTTHSTSLPPLTHPNPASSTWEPAPNLNTLAPMLSGLSLFYGHTEWGRNAGLSDVLLARLGECARRRVDESGDEGIWRGGMIVDTPHDFVKKDKYNVVTKCVREFEVNVLLVVGKERLYVEMSKLMSTNKTVQVVRVPKNGGATALDSAYRRRLQASQIRSYFYGGPALSMGSLSPHSISIRHDVLSLNRIGDESLVPLSALPIGHTRTIQDTQLVQLDPVEGPGELLSKLCALPQIEGSRKRRAQKKEDAEAAPETAKTEADANPVKQEGEEAATEVKTEEGADGEQNKGKQELPEEEEEPDEEEEVDEDDVEDVVIASSAVMGFVHISAVDNEKHKYTVLSPIPGKLPRTRLLLGSVEWQDT